MHTHNPMRMSAYIHQKTRLQWGSGLVVECLPGVLVRISIALVKYHKQNKVVEERIYLAYISTLKSIIERSQNRNSNRAGT